MITRSGTHALKALAVLGGLSADSFAGAAVIARQIKAPANYLGKLLRQLSRAGIVEARKGSNGGFRLSRGARSISLLDILDPIEHPRRFRSCILGRPKCGNANPCVLHENWSRVRDQYLAFLESTTLSDLGEDRTSRGCRKSGPNKNAARTAAGGVR